MAKKVDIKDWGIIKRKRYDLALKKNSNWDYLDELDKNNLIDKLGSVGINSGITSVLIRLKQQFTKEHFIKLRKHYYVVACED